MNPLSEARLRMIGSEAYGDNPFTRLMIDSLENTGAVEYRPYSPGLSISGWPQVWHLNWPETGYAASNGAISALKAAKLISQIDIARKRGALIAWTVHNLDPHRRLYPIIEDRFWRGFRDRVDLFIHLSDAGGAWYREIYPPAEWQDHVHLRHPAYAVSPETAPSRARARMETGFRDSDAIAIIPGRIRPYKNIPEAIQAFGKLSMSGQRLVVAGSCDTTALGAEVRRAAASFPRVDLRMTALQESELISLIRSSDLVLLPYGEFLNSGVLMLALSLHRPVLVPSTPVTEEIRSEVGAAWVRTFASHETMGIALHSALVEFADRQETNGPNLEKYQWPRFAEHLIRSIRQLRCERPSTVT